MTKLKKVESTVNFAIDKNGVAKITFEGPDLIMDAGQLREFAANLMQVADNADEITGREHEDDGPCLDCALTALAAFAVALGKHLEDDTNLMAFGPMTEWSDVLVAFAPFFGGEGQTKQ